MYDPKKIEISVVIPTYNRKQRLLALLHNLSASSFAVKEVIIADAGSDRLSQAELGGFASLAIDYLHIDTASVCVQRNAGVVLAKAPWVFVCDDDIEVPPDYLGKLAAYILNEKKVVAVSGNVLHLQKDKWVTNFEERSARQLLWKYFFGLSIWGEIKVRPSLFTKRIIEKYRKKGNHIAKTGWPVLTDFYGKGFTTPVYGLGAAVINKDWLRKYKYDETIDKNGIGDNYGLAINFPPDSIHIVNNAFVFHHKEMNDRLDQPLAFYRRILAMDHFRQQTKNNNIKHVKKRWLIWSLIGCMIQSGVGRNIELTKASWKLIVKITFNKNDYVIAAAKNKKIVEPCL